MNIPCPYCGEDTVPRNTGLGRDDNPIPATGDLNVCAHCLSLAVFEVDGDVTTLRRMTDDERAELVNRALSTWPRERWAEIDSFIADPSGRTRRARPQRKDAS